MWYYSAAVTGDVNEGGCVDRVTVDVEHDWKGSQPVDVFTAAGRQPLGPRCHPTHSDQPAELDTSTHLKRLVVVELGAVVSQQAGG